MDLKLVPVGTYEYVLLLNDPSMLTRDGIMNQMASAPIGSSTLAEASGRGFLGGAERFSVKYWRSWIRLSKR